MRYLNINNKTTWSFVMWIAIVFSLVMSGLNAAENQQLPFISDSDHILGSVTIEQMTQFLETSANKRNVSLWVIVFNEDTDASLSTLAHEKMAKLENDYPQMRMIKRRALLFVNVKTHESWIILRDFLEKEEGFMDVINTIHQEILFQHLVNNRVDQALWESTVALVMALEERAQPAPALIFIQWLEAHLFISLSSLCRWILSLLICLMSLHWIKKLFHRPHWEETLDQELLASLPENLSVSDLTAIMISLKKDQHVES